MKLLVLVLSTVVAFSASASDKTQDARAKFNKMGSVEAYNSNMFNKRIANIHIPGANMSVKASALCIKGNMIQTKTASYRQVCSKWSFRHSDGETRTTTDVALANRKDSRCIATVNGAKIQSPINFVKEVTVWGARKSGELVDEIGGQPTTFSSFARAQEEGTPVSLGTKSVHVTVPTTYKVDFFRKTASDKFNRNKQVGTHVFGLGQCN